MRRPLEQSLDVLRLEHCDLTTLHLVLTVDQHPSVQLGWQKITFLLGQDYQPTAAPTQAVR